MMFGGRTRRREVLAGLALHGDSLRYIELEEEAEGLREVRRVAAPIPEGCILRESVRDFDLLERAFRALKKEAGTFPCPVALGIPAGDAALKLLDYPVMPLVDVREALDLEFQRRFPWPREEAVLDAAVVEAPLRTPCPRMAVLAAATSRTAANGLLWMARRAGVPVAAIEPMNAALLRAVSGARGEEEALLVLGLEPEVHTLILSRRGSGLLSRSIPNNWKGKAELDGTAQAGLARDVLDTLAFAAARFRGLDVRRLVLAGSLGAGEHLRTALEAGTSLSAAFSGVEDAWRIQGAEYAGFEAAVGLALRGRARTMPEEARFDLRPAEFIERKRRRHSFSALRLLASSLGLAFVLSCGGCLVLALREARVLSRRAAAWREEVAALEERQSALMTELSRLRAREEVFARRLREMGREAPALEVMDALERLARPEVSLRAVRFACSTNEEGEDVCVVTVEGDCPEEEPVSALMER
ncbi:MAG: hypothetical protein IJ702_05950, partial [Fretibacterium sp.]|nr:hypothetical protein [Fretibacterium sp.]